MEVEPTQDLSQVKMIALFVQWIGMLMLFDPLPFLFADVRGNADFIKKKHKFAYGNRLINARECVVYSFLAPVIACLESLIN